MKPEQYAERLQQRHEEFEKRCRRCGNCCGVFDGDPCRNLKQEATGAYHCAAYGNRLGEQMTVSGKKFTCVPIRELLRFDLPYAGCGYLNR